MSAAARPIWQTHLDVGNAERSDYDGYANAALADLFHAPPRLMLDVGCAGGRFGELVKQRYPACKVVGVELNRAAAAAARTRLDHVFEQRIEDIDFAAAGYAANAFDTAVLADVLEHVYNPWQVLVDLRAQLTADAQVVASIPNTRNLRVALGLLDRGEWNYAERGLLDITHIRFFTQSGIQQLFEQTGYRIERAACILDPNLQQIHAQALREPRHAIRYGRVTIDDLTPQELTELCTWQYCILARPQ